MEKQLFQGIVLPLEEFAYRRVVACLLTNTLNSCWNQRNKSDLLEIMIKDKVDITNLLPLSLRNRLMPLIQPMYKEIFNWYIYHVHKMHDMREYFNGHFLKHLQWTCTGKIDYPKTVEKIIDLKLFHAEKRYELACLYCLKDYIPLLWAELPKESKRRFYKSSRYFSFMKMELYWLKVLLKRDPDWKFFYENHAPNTSRFFLHAFKLSAREGNKAAVRYFFQRLCDADREPYLLYAISDVLNEWKLPLCKRLLSDFSMENLSDVLCYLLSLLSPERQMQVLKTHACDILICFQNWPLRDLFLEVADVIWTFLPEEMYLYLLNNMRKNIKTSYYFCPKLFQNFFQWSPCNFKKKFVDKECQFGYFFREFFLMGDSETIEAIFRSLETADRVRLVFSKCVFKLLCDSIFCNKFQMVKVCLQESMLLKEDRQRLKNNFLKFIEDINKSFGAEMITRKQQEFHEFFESCIRNPDEEQSEDETLTKAKKLCTEEKRNVLPSN